MRPVNKLIISGLRLHTSAFVVYRRIRCKSQHLLASAYKPIRVYGYIRSKDGVGLRNSKGHALGSVVDRFGVDVQVSLTDEGIACVSAVVLEPPTFYGWVAQFGGDVTIESPKHLRESFAARLESTLKTYR